MAFSTTNADAGPSTTRRAAALPTIPLPLALSSHAPAAVHPSAREDLHAIQSIVGALVGTAGVDDAVLAAHAGRIRGARRVLVEVLDGVVGRPGRTHEPESPTGGTLEGMEGMEGKGEGESSELEYVEPDGPYGTEGAYSPGSPIDHTERRPPGPEEPAAGVVQDMRSLWGEKWRLALDHIRECEAAQRRDRQELIAAIIDARRAAARGTRRPR